MSNLTVEQPGGSTSIIWATRKNRGGHFYSFSELLWILDQNLQPGFLTQDQG